ncbi:hypothetical protein [Reichenbachiella sp.]|uniref:hypothetical protein n=1 Tax=Reichenbachiella sp. TaxID=2184521 RepID=UPI0032992077
MNKLKRNKYLFSIIVTLLLAFTSCNKEKNTGFEKPTGIYINWASYDELSDTVKLDEKIAMRQLKELIRLRKLGVQIDYYLMDAFWFDKDGGYREWRKESWPNGHDDWLQTCINNDIKPGLWISTNVLGWRDLWMNSISDWQTSINSNGDRLSLFEGNYLPHLIESMQMWVDRGILMFKFDFADFHAVTPELENKLSQEEIFQKNVDAFQNALKSFRKKNPEVRILAYNGYGGQYDNTGVQFEKNIDLSWLETFDALYCGDPRLADVPAFNFWRSKDIYSDHQVQQYQYNGVPLHRIDNSSFMIGNTGTCYGRSNTAWKGTLILSLARGGWANTYYGNLDLLTDDDARWFSKVQSVFLPFQKIQAISTFGAIPGTAEPYGYLAQSKDGAVITLVNPKQSFAKINLPVSGDARLLFTDSGFAPQLDGNQISLGPEQMAVIGINAYADAKFDLGLQNDVVIPVEIDQIETNFVSKEKNNTTTSFQIPDGKDIRIVWQQFDNDSLPKRTANVFSGQGESLADILIIKAEQDGISIPVEIHYDRIIWSGLSWAIGEIKAKDLKPDVPLSLSCISKESTDVNLQCRVFTVEYQ